MPQEGYDLNFTAGDQRYGIESIPDTRGSALSIRVLRLFLHLSMRACALHGVPPRSGSAAALLHPTRTDLGPEECVTVRASFGDCESSRRYCWGPGQGGGVMGRGWKGSQGRWGRYLERVSPPPVRREAFCLIPMSGDLRHLMPIQGYALHETER
jgi:hypothetical protein